VQEALSEGIPSHYRHRVLLALAQLGLLIVPKTLGGDHHRWSWLILAPGYRSNLTGVLWTAGCRNTEPFHPANMEPLLRLPFRLDRAALDGDLAFRPQPPHTHDLTACIPRAPVHRAAA
jgi:hypothetical protein